MVDLVPGLTGADATAAGLLIECRGQTEQALNVSIQPDTMLASEMVTVRGSRMAGCMCDQPSGALPQGTVLRFSDVLLSGRTEWELSPS